MAASEPAAALPAEPPASLRTGPLALAAGTYWRHCREAHLAVRFIEREAPRRAAARSLLRFDAEVAVSAIEGLRELADTGHPRVRALGANALPSLVSRLTAFVESCP